MALPYPQRIFEDPKRMPETVDCMKVLVLSCVRLLATPWTIDRQAPHSMGFSRQEYWSGVGCHFLLQGKLCNPGIKPVPVASPELAGKFFTTSPIWEALWIV